MSAKQSLILLRNDASLAITVTPEALAKKEEAMESAGFVKAVFDAQSQEMAVAAQTDCQRLISVCEKSRQDVKKPVLDYGRLIDDTAKAFVDALKTEAMRLSKLIGDFQAKEAARIRSEEAARNESLLDIERQREAELAQAKTLQEREVTHERYNQAVQFVPPAPVAPKADGQIVRPTWEFEVTSLRDLYLNHPALVNLEPRRADIKEALKGGLKITGIKAWQETKSTVRL